MNNVNDRRYTANKVFYYDIETTGLDQYNDSIISIGYLTNNNYHNIILEDINDETIYKKFLSRIYRLFEHYANHDYIFVSFNGLFFDLPFIIEQFIKHKIYGISNSKGNSKLRLFKYKKMNKITNNVDKAYHVTFSSGKVFIHIDLLDIILKYWDYKFRKGWSLNDIAETLNLTLKTQINDLPYEIYKQDLNIFKEYQKQDVILLHDIDTAMNIVPLMVKIAKIANIQPSQCNSTTIMCENLLKTYGWTTEYDEQHENDYKLKGEIFYDSTIYPHYEGGYNNPPIPGKHDNVHVYDFKSLYPTIMSKICFHPILQLIATDLLNKRAEANNNNNNNDQLAYKLLANSLYGFIGSKYSNKANLNIASLVTFIGRVLNIKGIEIFKNYGFITVLSSTDSFYVKQTHAKNNSNSNMGKLESAVDMGKLESAVDMGKLESAVDMGKLELAVEEIEEYATTIFSYFNTILNNCNDEELELELYGEYNYDAETFTELFPTNSIEFNTYNYDLVNNFLEHEDIIHTLYVSNKIKSYIKVKDGECEFTGPLVNKNHPAALRPVICELLQHYNVNNLNDEDILECMSKHKYDDLLAINRINKRWDEYSINSELKKASLIMGIKPKVGDKLVRVNKEIYYYGDEINWNTVNSNWVQKQFIRKVKKELSHFKLLSNEK